MAENPSVLKPYKQILGAAAIYLAIATNLTEVETCMTIYKKGNTENINPLPFIRNVMMGLIRYKTGDLSQDDTIMNINTVIIFLNSIYCLLFFIYTKDKWNDFLRYLSVCMMVPAVMWKYAEWEDPSTVKCKYGLLVTLMTFMLMIGPVTAAVNVFQTGDASEISLWWTLLSWFFALSLILYTTVTNLKFIKIQNCAVFLLHTVKLLLLFMFRKNTEKED